MHLTYTVQKYVEQVRNNVTKPTKTFWLMATGRLEGKSCCKVADFDSGHVLVQPRTVVSLY